MSCKHYVSDLNVCLHCTIAELEADVAQLVVEKRTAIDCSLRKDDEIARLNRMLLNKKQANYTAMRIRPKSPFTKSLAWDIIPLLDQQATEAKP